MNERHYKYRREDFGELPVDLHHLTIYLNFTGDRVEAINRLEMSAKNGCDEIHLDANSLEIISVEWCGSNTKEGISKTSLLSFPQAKRVGNPSDKKDSGQARMTKGVIVILIVGFRCSLLNFKFGKNGSLLIFNWQITAYPLTLCA